MSFLFTGGGLAGRKESGQLRFGGREKPFRAPLYASILFYSCTLSYRIIVLFCYQIIVLFCNLSTLSHSFLAPFDIVLKNLCVVRYHAK